MEWLQLAGKRAVITGAGGGIGQALARAFVAAGAKVVLLDRDTAQTGPLAAELGASARALACDISDPAALAEAAAGVEAEGGADILVNNAGIRRAGMLAELPLADWNDLLAVNLTGYHLTTQAFGAGMRARGQGVLLHVTSITARHPQPDSGAYSVAKAGVVMLSNQLSREWGGFGIRSNCLSPGLVRTPLSEVFYADPAVKSGREAMVPLGRIATPEDMADAALFLASPRASYITGQDLVIDGGLSQGLMGLVPRPPRR